MESEESPTLPDQPSVQALQEQLDKALALLGQKELENAILKRLLKKNDTP
jgi:hypothetical protein